MATTNIKNRHTLFNFSSVRNAEKSNPEKQQERYVFLLDSVDSAYMAAMRNRTANQTKKQVMQATSVNLFKYSETSLKADIGSNFYDAAIWLAQNRTKFVLETLNTKINGLAVLNPVTSKKVWDNLFYQIFNSQSVYIREMLMQVLVLDNLLRHKTLSPIDNTKVLANATVVIPGFLFDEDKISETLPQQQEPTNDIATARTVRRNQAYENINAAERAKKEFIKDQDNYRKLNTARYKEEYARYQEDIAPIIERYEEELLAEKIRIEALTTAPERSSSSTIFNVAPLRLPRFEFTTEPALIEIENRLNPDIYEFINRYGVFTDSETHEDVLKKIDQQIANFHAEAINNTDFYEPVLVIAGVGLPLSEPLEPNSAPTNANINIDPNTIQKHGVRLIGIEDYKKVVSTICCYDAGEVAHIENVMAKELRSKTTTRERSTELTETTETQQESEQISDTITVQRFEMQNEISKLMQEQKQFNAYANFSAEYSPIRLDVGASYASNTSKEESNRQALTEAKEITQRATQRILTKVRTETVKKTSERFEEVNLHSFDNRESTNHVSGIYRFINAIYRNQIYNYGKRMIYEFMVPQPGQLHKLGMVSNIKNNIPEVKRPIDPRSLGYTDSSKILEYNVQAISAIYEAAVNPYPDKTKTIGKTFSGSKVGADEVFNENFEIPIPEGYETYSAKIRNYARYDNDKSGQSHSFAITVGNINSTFSEIQYDLNNYFNTEEYYSADLEKYTKSIPVSFHSLNYLAFNISISIVTVPTPQTIRQWQHDTFNAIIQGYNNQLAAYNQYESESANTGKQNLATNPGFYRQIEQVVLRKACIDYLINPSIKGATHFSGTSLNTYRIHQSQKFDEYASLAKFMEQAFDWNLISYNFYPFYWGSMYKWNELYQFNCDDPLLRSFMQAGLARVFVTVKPGFEAAVMHFMATGQIWNGGQVPVVDDLLYLSITDEIKEQQYVVEETWETVVPTSLVALQDTGVVIKETKGLHCNDECNDQAALTFVANTDKLNSTTM